MLQNATLQRVDLTRAILLDVRGLPTGLTDDARVFEATLDWRTVAGLVHRDGIGSLLIATGMPAVSATYLVDSLRSIDAADLFTLLQSVFLSYGSPDAAFADRLRTDLSGNGVKIWYYPIDATPGEAILSHIERALGHFDPMVVCCSRAGLVRPGVVHELDAALRRERAEGSTVLLPVLVDDVFETGAQVPDWWPSERRSVYEALHNRVCADVRDRSPGSVPWNDALGRLLGALRRPE
ncbi:MAG: toll/interleukin-1 receptor domain-containing protein [Myxococcota bacterium]